MKFSYTALGTDNQKLTGELEADSIQAAREELHQMNLSVIVLEEVKGAQKNDSKSPTPKDQDTTRIETYYFEANDPQGKKVNGTIDANDPYLAYKRLKIEYQFDILELYLYEAQNTQSSSFAAEFNAWNQKLLEEGLVGLPKKENRVKNELGDETEPVAQEIVSEIDHFIGNTKKIIEAYKSQYSEVFLSEIEKILANLERIRGSNNLNHITRVCNDLYDLISHPDKKDPALDEDYEKAMGQIKTSGFIQSKSSPLSLESEPQNAEKFEKIKGILGSIEKKLGTGNKILSDIKTESKIDEAFEASRPFRTLTKKYFIYLKEGNPILKKARKEEFDLFLSQWKSQKQKLKADQTQLQKEFKEVRDFSNLFSEINSFVGWLLFFYISYFFLVSFSFEKNIGLSQELVVRTLSSPLIINICIFLILTHLSLKLKQKFFRANLIGSTFLFFLSFGCYVLLIANF